MESLEDRVKRVVSEWVEVVGYDPCWPQMFDKEKKHLLSCLPGELLIRIEHFGSTAVPGLAAKPIIDMLVEVSSLEETKRRIVPVLEAQWYDYFWRPSWGNDTPPYYAWFIKRNAAGQRTHHIHMIENNSLFDSHWDRLLFRDYLIKHPETAREYQKLKIDLSKQFNDDRVGYTKAKTEFILRITAKAKNQ
ncbi:MAG: GrpB family protein [Dehalococcoidales bacterium]|jgi:GrpB-like predicted nucleotidyltransferase (UPF0157 family)|nr:GrpB family protein [Dehalococcoidales bacterium]